jgi:hypothetical protein
MFATSSVVVNRLISVVGRIFLRNSRSASSWETPVSLALACIHLLLARFWRGPASTLIHSRFAQFETRLLFQADLPLQVRHIDPQDEAPASSSVARLIY